MNFKCSVAQINYLMKLKSDLSAEGAKALFESVWQVAPLMQTMSRAHFAELSLIFKVLSFTPGTVIIERGETAEWLGIVADGSAAAQRSDKEIGKLSVGAMIGFVEASDLEKGAPFEYDVIALSYGYMAIITLTDLKIYKNKRPTLVLFRLME